MRACTCACVCVCVDSMCVYVPVPVPVPVCVNLRVCASVYVIFCTFFAHACHISGEHMIGVSVQPDDK